MDNLHIKAARKKWRFQSSRGELTVEQVWDLPLQSRDGFDIDTVAKTVNSGIKALSEDSFVTQTETPALVEAIEKLELLRGIIKVKLDEYQKRVKRSERAAQRQQILEALAKKDAEALTSGSRDELLAKLAALDAD